MQMRLAERIAAATRMCRPAIRRDLAYSRSFSSGFSCRTALSSAL
jgi:hypothetical protein